MTDKISDWYSIIGKEDNSIIAIKSNKNIKREKLLINKKICFS